MPVMMTPETLLHLRQQRMLTRDELAKELGLPSGSTINKWERGINPIPDWVAEKMYRSIPIEFTIDELAELYEICRELKIGMHQLVADALRPMIQQRIRERELKAQPQPKYTTGGSAGSHDISQVAEEHEK